MAAPPISRHKGVAISPHGELTAVDQGGLWPYTWGRWRLRPNAAALLDPVNLLVVDTHPIQVHAVLISAGWTRPDDGAVHVTRFERRRVRMHDHAACGSRQERIHVRLFAVAGHTVAAAHHEVADARGHHVVTSWDRAREEVVAALTGQGYAQLAPSAALVAPDVREVPGDGRIWRLHTRTS